MAKLRKQTDWLATHYPGAAASLREGMEETFTINRLELSPTLRRCLGTTNIIESPQAGVRLGGRNLYLPACPPALAAQPRLAYL